MLPELLKNITGRIGKYKILIFIAGIFIGALFYMYAKTIQPIYTAKATVFPLNSSSESSSSSALSGLLGLGDVPKNFSSEASISIIELAVSRNLMRSVAAKRLPEFDNKNISALLFEEINKNKYFFEKKAEFPKDSIAQVIIGSSLLRAGFVTKMSKNGVLELYFSNTNPDILQPITETIITTISQFYIDLKTKKAQADYAFSLAKIDSIQKTLDFIDHKAIGIQKNTFFTPGLLQYELPKDNLSVDKQRIIRTRDNAIANKDEAMWRLQKMTPIIAMLDKPEPPFDIKAPSALPYGISGFILGCLFTIIFVNGNLLYNAAKTELAKLMGQ
ncbi:MAG: hypothetical protein HY305_02365 [Sphingobacteriales bacterium]|nr:hypothetical protein [Sphingobacteriales bacterium]